MSEQPIPAVRPGAGGANHHLWGNNGTWWIHLTFHLGSVKYRFRASLGTRKVEHARELRDALLALFGVNPNAL